MFHVGQRVHHSSPDIGDGTVTAVAEDGTIKVEFDRRTERGKLLTGTYPLRWHAIASYTITPIE